MKTDRPMAPATTQGLERPFRTIWFLAFPIILSNITVPLLGAVDTAVMGHMESAAYLGAVAIGALIFDYIFWGFGFLRQSTTGLAAQALGAEDGTEARAIFARCLVLVGIISALLWSTQGLIFQAAETLIDASPEVETFAATYFHIRIWGAPAELLNFAIVGWLLAAKDTRGVLIQQVFTNGLNIALNLWFVWGVGMTIDGVALASLIAQYGGMALGLWLMRAPLKKIAGTWTRSSLLDPTQLKRMMGMNINIFIRTIVLLSAFAWFTAESAKMGDNVLGANTILIQFLFFIAFSLDGFAHAVEVLSGHSVGRRNIHEFHDAVRVSTQMAAICAVLMTVFIGLSAGWMVPLFTSLPDVAQLARDHWVWVSILPLVAVWSFQLDGIFFGLTQTTHSRNMMIVSAIIFVLSGWALMPLWGNHGLWLAFTIFMGMRGITLWIVFPRVRKKVFACPPAASS